MNTPRRPRFSVVIPALDEAATISACLESLAQQDFGSDVEIIVVDNNSRDATSAVAIALGATVYVEPVPGVCHARQLGTSLALGEIVVSADADTTYETSWLTSIDLFFRENPRHVAIAGPCRFVDAPRWGVLYSALLFGVVQMIFRITGRVVYVSASNIAFRRDAWTGYDVHLTQGGDELGLLRRLRAGGPIGFTSKHPSHTSARRMRKGLVYSLVVTCFYYYLLGYTLNRCTGRQVIPMAPSIRGDPERLITNRRRNTYLGASLLVVLATGWAGYMLA